MAYHSEVGLRGRLAVIRTYTSIMQKAMTDKINSHMSVFLSVCLSVSLSVRSVLLFCLFVRPSVTLVCPFCPFIMPVFFFVRLLCLYYFLTFSFSLSFLSSSLFLSLSLLHTFKHTRTHIHTRTHAQTHFLTASESLSCSLFSARENVKIFASQIRSSTFLMANKMTPLSHSFTTPLLTLTRTYTLTCIRIIREE